MVFSRHLEKMSDGVSRSCKSSLPFHPLVDTSRPHGGFEQDLSYQSTLINRNEVLCCIYKNECMKIKYLNMQVVITSLEKGENIFRINA